MGSVSLPGGVFVCLAAAVHVMLCACACFSLFSLGVPGMFVVLFHTWYVDSYLPCWNHLCWVWPSVSDRIWPRHLYLSPTVNYFGHWVWCGCRRVEIVSQTWKATHANTCTSMLRIPPMLLQVYISLCSPTDAPKMSTSHGVFVWCLCSFRLVVRLSPFHYWQRLLWSTLRLVRTYWEIGMWNTLHLVWYPPWSSLKELVVSGAYQILRGMLLHPRKTFWSWHEGQIMEARLIHCFLRVFQPTRSLGVIISSYSMPWLAYEYRGNRT